MALSPFACSSEDGWACARARVGYRVRPSTASRAHRITLGVILATGSCRVGDMSTPPRTERRAITTAVAVATTGQAQNGTSGAPRRASDLRNRPTITRRRLRQCSHGSAFGEGRTRGDGRDLRIRRSLGRGRGRSFGLPGPSRTRSGASQGCRGLRARRAHQLLGLRETRHHNRGSLRGRRSRRGKDQMARSKSRRGGHRPADHRHHPGSRRAGGGALGGPRLSITCGYRSTVPNDNRPGEVGRPDLHVGRAVLRIDTAARALVR